MATQSDRDAQAAKKERDAAARAVTENMAKLKALRLAKEALEPPKTATAKKKKAKPAEKGATLSAFLAGEQSGGRRT